MQGPLFFTEDASLRKTTGPFLVDSSPDKSDEVLFALLLVAIDHRDAAVDLVE